MYNWSQSLIKLIITLWWKPRRVFLPFHFVGEKPRGGFPPRVFFYFAWKASNDEKYFNSASILFCKAIQLKTNLFIFQKTLRGFSPTIWNGRKTPRGKLKVGIKPYQSFSELITIKQTYFLNLFWYSFFWKNPAGFFPHLKMWGKNPAQGFKNPAGF